MSTSVKILVRLQALSGLTIIEMTETKSLLLWTREKENVTA